MDEEWQRKKPDIDLWPPKTHAHLTYMCIYTYYTHTHTSVCAHTYAQ